MEYHIGIRLPKIFFFSGQKNFGKTLHCYTMDKCGHLICSICLKDYIYKATEEKVIFNIYENKLNPIKYFCPECNAEIYLSQNLINNLFNIYIYYKEYKFSTLISPSY